jgi:hypothetical protein
MDLYKLLLLQFLAHVLSDYTLQSDQQAKEKNADGFRSPFLKWHALTVFVLSWLLSFELKFVTGALVIAITHWLIDGCKPYMKFHRLSQKYAFFIDQSIHLVILTGVVLGFYHWDFVKCDLHWMPISYVIVLSSFILCTKPANIFIKEVIMAFDISIEKSESDNKDLPNAGKLIGILERWLILIFILYHQFEAVGFLIAAKSILRYREDAILKTEYVLIGSMLSYGIAIVLGIGCQVVLGG